MKGPISRKAFLEATAKTVVAASAGAAGMSLVAASDEQTRQVPITVRAAGQAFTWPWPYAKLVAEDVLKRAHKGYYDGGCCYGAFSSLLTSLAEVVGEPFTSMPPQMMYYGGGGGAGWGTLCGAVNGAAALINLVVDRTNANLIINELFGWYTKVPFPSDASNHYGVQRAFLVNRIDRSLKQTVAGSVLCHSSVSTWCTESFFKTGSPERAERCARLTGDVAGKTVELLNQFSDRQFRATFVPPRSVSDCMSCHDTAGIGNVISTVKMDCQQCHKERWDHLY